MISSQSDSMRWYLFVVFVGLFVVVSVLTILSLFFGIGNLNERHEGKLVTAFILEVGGAVVALFYSLFSLKPPASSETSAAIQEFCRRAAGYWWSSADAGLVGFVTFSHDKTAGTLTINGVSYDGEANTGHTWESAGSFISRSGNKLNYCWKGVKKEIDKESIQWREGFGEISFEAFEGAPIDSATSWFFDTNIADVTGATKKSSIFKRCNDEEKKTMKGKDRKEIALLVKQQLAHRRQVT